MLKMSLSFFINVIIGISLCLVSCDHTCETCQNIPHIADQEFLIHENAPNGTIVGRLRTDSMYKQFLYFYFESDTIVHAFLLNDSTGEILVNDSALIDYELDSIYVFNMLALNKYTGDAVRFVATIKILDIEESQKYQMFYVDENSPLGTSLGFIQVDSLVSEAPLFIPIDFTQAFSLNENTGEITVKDKVLVDFEVQSTYFFLIQVLNRNNGDVCNSIRIIIYVNDLPE